MRYAQKPVCRMDKKAIDKLPTDLVFRVFMTCGRYAKFTRAVPMNPNNFIESILFNIN